MESPTKTVEVNTVEAVSQVSATASYDIGRATFKGTKFSFDVEVGTKAIIRVWAVHKMDVAVYAENLLNGGRPGIAQLLFEMQSTPGQYTFEQILDNGLADLEAFSKPAFQNQVMELIAGITGAPYKKLINELDEQESTQKKDEPEA